MDLSVVHSSDTDADDMQFDLDYSLHANRLDYTAVHFPNRADFLANFVKYLENWHPKITFN